MSELQGPVNTENELKFLTDEVGLDTAREWGGKKQLCTEGVVWFHRSHLFYDTDALDLARMGWGFRRRTDRFSYCLKYPVAHHEFLLERREIFARKLAFALDFRNPLHRRAPIMTRVVDLLHGKYSDDPKSYETAIHSIIPRIRIDCTREYFFSVAGNSADRSIGMALDRVEAYEYGSNDLIHKWCEVELETGWGYTEHTNAMVSLGRELSNEIGLVPTVETKYEIACKHASWLDEKAKG